MMGNLRFVGQLDDVGGHVLHEAGGLDEERGGAGHHHPAAELALPLQVALDREHGGEHHLAAGQPVGDVGDLAHRHRSHPAVEPVLAGKEPGVLEDGQLEYLFDCDWHGTTPRYTALAIGTRWRRLRFDQIH